MNDLLVSVIVLSYNSEKTILATLNSIFFQTYGNIELIIQDDCSTDCTINIIREWVEDKKKRFKNVIISKNNKNVGISSNANKGLQLASAEWIKYIAADDILLPDCIKDNMFFMQKYDKRTTLFSGMFPFKQEGNKIEFWKMDREEKAYITHFFHADIRKQKKYILKRDILLSPTLFINKQVIEELNGFDERIRNIEDWPLKIKLFQNNYRVVYMPKTTVLYRQGESVSHSINKMFKEEHIRQKRLLKTIFCYPYISKVQFWYYFEEQVIRLKEDIIINKFHNRRSITTQIINSCFNLFSLNKWKKILLYKRKNIQYADINDVMSGKIVIN